MNYNERNKNLLALIEKLKSNLFYDKNGEPYIFAYWDTDKAGAMRIFQFMFYKKSDTESGNANRRAVGFSLYNQHLNGYSNAFDLLVKGWEKIAPL